MSHLTELNSLAAAPMIIIHRRRSLSPKLGQPLEQTEASCGLGRYALYGVNANGDIFIGNSAAAPNLSQNPGKLKQIEFDGKSHVFTRTIMPSTPTPT
jgi:hypothetical protein